MQSLLFDDHFDFLFSIHLKNVTGQCHCDLVSQALSVQLVCVAMQVVPDWFDSLIKIPPLNLFLQWLAAAHQSHPR